MERSCTRRGRGASSPRVFETPAFRVNQKKSLETRGNGGSPCDGARGGESVAIEWEER